MINNKTYSSSDSPQYFYTSAISDEFDNLMLDLKSKHKDLPFYIFVVFRCLHTYSNWVTKGRFSIDDDSMNTIKGELCLGVDVVVYEEDFEKIPNIRTNKVLQRLMFGKELFMFLTDKFDKSTRKIPYLNVHKDAILADIKKWCFENYWMKETEFIDFDVKNWTLQKAELVFGKPVSKRVLEEIDRNIHLETDLKALKYQNLVWNIDGNRHIECWFLLTENKKWLCCWCQINSPTATNN